MDAISVRPWRIVFEAAYRALMSSLVVAPGFHSSAKTRTHTQTATDINYLDELDINKVYA